jgi:hypothetical protein
MTLHSAIASDAPIDPEGPAPEPGAIVSPLLAQALAPFAPVADAFDEIDRTVDTLAEIGGRPVAAQTRKLKRTLKRCEPSVTMIGQVKAGKTSLINAMVGAPGLLPADVNPWTSVVTSLHLAPQPAPDSAQAVFRFFDADQWDRLMQKGGRIGELAGRAGAEEEVAKVADQLKAMRRKSMRRLGRQFELLMGQEHRYGYVDPELVQRYVCLGDDFGGEEAHEDISQGRFADITKAADLYLHRPDFPVPLCLRDTPGVNDTFLMREQITIQAIRDSRTCVVVLSAHQAMSAVDMALIRLIANIPSRDVVIFVNRIDELSDPGEHVTEIEDSIRQTILDHRGPSDAEIVFGSAIWAEHAIAGTLDEMDPQSAESLLSWSEAEWGDLPQDDEGRFDAEAVWALSGVPGLYGALADRVSETVGREVADEVARSALNVTSQLETEHRVLPRAAGASGLAPTDRASLLPEADALEARLADTLTEDFDRIVADFHKRLDRARAGFVDRAVAALVQHLEQKGDETVWTYDPTGLRILLRSAFTVYSSRMRSLTQDIFGEAADEIGSLYVRGFGLDARSFALAPPAPPQIAPPVFLGETIALDLNAGWWSRWWNRRRGFQTYATRVSELVSAECDRMVDAVKAEYGTPDRDRALVALRLFVADQRKALVDLWMRDEVRPEDVAERVGGPDQRHAEALAEARETLARHVTDTTSSTEAA